MTKKKVKKIRKEATKIADDVADLMTKHLESWTFTQSHMKSNLIYTTRFHIEVKVSALLEKLK